VIIPLGVARPSVDIGIVVVTGVDPCAPQQECDWYESFTLEHVERDVTKGNPVGTSALTNENRPTIKSVPIITFVRVECGEFEYKVYIFFFWGGGGAVLEFCARQAHFPNVSSCEVFFL